MKTLTIFMLVVAAAAAAITENDIFDYSEVVEIADDRAAPWWVQKEEAKRRECRSSCTQYSKGVKSLVNLCDDTKVCSIVRLKNAIQKQIWFV